VTDLSAESSLNLDDIYTSVDLLWAAVREGDRPAMGMRPGAALLMLVRDAIAKIDYLKEERRLLALRLGESSDTVSRLVRERDTHPFTCGYCDWGRDGAYHDYREFQSHMAIAHPEYKS
jgi:hypothetical protein